MKTTPFLDKHLALGAKMVDFADFYMPVYYSGIKEEHLVVRNKAGMFDVSHMGEFILEGKDALDLIQRITTNDASRLVKGKAQYSCMTNEEGGIIDDLLVYCLEKDQQYMLVVNAGNIQKDLQWIASHNHKGVIIRDVSNETGLLAIQGPSATRIIASLTGPEVMNLPYYNFILGNVAGIENSIISATGYTGSGGVELYFPVKENNAAILWDALMDAGKQYGLKPAGLGARDTLRLEMGYCLYGNDINEKTSPLQAGLGWITKFTKEFIGKHALEKEKEEGAGSKLVGFEMLDRGIARRFQLIKNEDEKPIGAVTSGTQSPSLDKSIGLGYVEESYCSIGTTIKILVRDRLLKAKIVKVPFGISTH